MPSPFAWWATIRGMKIAVAAALLAAFPAWADGPVYRCPGNPESYTNLISPQEAKDRGCRPVEGAAVTVVTPVRRPPPPAASAAPAAPRDPGQRVDPGDQKARDADARRILQDELRREEERLAALQKDYNNGEPERRGDERNYQKYLDRVADLKAQILRKEADVAAIRRELSKLGPP